MPELRWTLLILGALFVVALALWELRRQKHARGQDASAGGRDGERVAPTFDENDATNRQATQDATLRADQRGFREPTLTLPDVHIDGRGSRAAVVDPPVVEIDEASLAELKVEPHTVVDEFSASTRPIARGHVSDEDVDRDDSQEDDERSDELEEDAEERVAPAEGDAQSDTSHHAAARQSRNEADRPDADEGDQRNEAAGSREGFPRPAPTVFARADGNTHAASGAPLETDESLPEPIVEWPDEETRRIVALRLVAGTGERFSGRAVRQALAAEGFQVGKFEIFHKAGPDGRAVLSAASLTKPGTFSLGTMDAQRFGGLSLFAVLPGPLPAVATFDELMLTARSLNDRLRGALQDERGEPLTPTRSTTIRDSLVASSGPPAP